MRVHVWFVPRLFPRLISQTLPAGPVSWGERILTIYLQSYQVMNAMYPKATFAAELTRGPELLAIMENLDQEVELLQNPPAVADNNPDEDSPWWDSMDRSVEVLEKYAKRRAEDLEAFEGRPQALRMVDESTVAVLEVIAKIVPTLGAAMDVDCLRSLADVARKVGRGSEEQAFTECVPKVGCVDSTKQLQSVLETPPSLNRCTALYNAYKAVANVKLGDDLVAMLVDSDFTTKECLINARKRANLTSGNAQVISAMNFLNDLHQDTIAENLYDGARPDLDAFGKIFNAFMTVKSLHMEEASTRTERDEKAFLHILHTRFGRRAIAIV